MTEAVHIVCPHCATTNRMRTADLVKATDCGQCHRPLFTGEPLELDEAGFVRHISRNQIPVLVDFWAPWCGPCLRMAPSYKQAAAQLEPSVRVVKVNTEETRQLGSRLNIRSIPTLALFLDGREIARQPGAMGVNEIVRWTQAHVGRHEPRNGS